MHIFGNVLLSTSRHTEELVSIAKIRAASVPTALHSPHPAAETRQE
jgi:hypothetical protein